MKTTSSAANNRTIIIVLIAGAVLFTASVFAWWSIVYNDPERLFRDAISHGLRTDSVTKKVVQDEGFQSVDQTNRLLLGERAAVVGRTELRQEAGELTARVVTENLGTPFDDYVRYVEIETNQESEDGGPLNFESVLGTWGLNGGQDPEMTSGELFSESVLGAIPFGRVSRGEQSRLVDFAFSNNVYEVDYLGLSKERRGNRPTYVYPVSIQPMAYVTYLKEFADAQTLTQLADLNPAAYASSPPLQFSLVIDVWSRQIIEINYETSDRSEVYSGHGILQTVALPEETVPVLELQERLQSIQ